jgi:hypothetical protein
MLSLSRESREEILAIFILKKSRLVHSVYVIDPLADTLLGKAQ